MNMIEWIEMSYNIELQIAGFLFTTILGIVYFSKPRWRCIQNSIFRILLILTWIELIFDFVSVITLYHRDKIPFITEFFCKGYIISMFVWTFLIVVYIISNTLHKNMSKRGIIARKIVVAMIFIPCVIGIVLAFIFPLEYAGSGRYLYTCGIIPNYIYMYSGYAVFLSFVFFLVNLKLVNWSRRIPVLFFITMEGVAGIIQFYFEGILIIGFGSSLCNICSEKFKVETADSKHRFTMVWKDNMSKNSEPKIDRTSQHYTRITYKPDLKRFGMDCIDDDSFKMMEKRVYEIAG